MSEDDPLEDFDPREITLDGVTKVVHVAGGGPAVIVMSEMPGHQPACGSLHSLGCRRGIHGVHALAVRPRWAVAGAEEGVVVFRRACMSARVPRVRRQRVQPVTSWLRSRRGLAHEQCGGPGVGAVGMCFTGNFALTMMLEPAMLAPVLSQPALPLDDPGGMEIAPDELTAVRERLERRT